MAPKSKKSDDQSKKGHEETIDPESLRKLQSNMLTQLKSSKATDAQKELLQKYQAEPRFSEKKKDWLLKWRNDKTCSWMQTYTESQEHTSESSSTRVVGYGTVCDPEFMFVSLCVIIVSMCIDPFSQCRYDVAKLCNMNYENPFQKKLVDSICEGLPADDDWDETDAFEKAYKSNKLKRYKLDKALLTKEKETDVHKEVLSTLGEKDCKGSQPSLGNTPSAPIKIQNPKHLDLMNAIKVTKSAAAATSSLTSLFKNILPTIVTCASPEGI